MPELIPLPVLFGNPERVSPNISPDGTQLAWIAPHEGVLNVWLAPVSAAEGADLAAARVITDDTDRGIRQFGWAHDGRHLLYVQDTGGDENWRLHDVDIQTMERRDLTPFEDVQVRLIAMERKLPNEILVGLNRDNPQLHDVYRLDLVTGELTKEVENPGFIGWVADAQMVVRGGLAPLPDGGFQLMVRDSGRRGLAAAAVDPGRGRAHQRRRGVQRGRAVAADHQLGRGADGPAGPPRRGHRRGRGAGRGPGGRRQRGPGAPGHPRAADRRGAQGPVAVPGPGPGGGR